MAKKKKPVKTTKDSFLTDGSKPAKKTKKKKGK